MSIECLNRREIIGKLTRCKIDAAYLKLSSEKKVAKTILTSGKKREEHLSTRAGGGARVEIAKRSAFNRLIIPASSSLKLIELAHINCVRFYFRRDEPRSKKSLYTMRKQLVI